MCLFRDCLQNAIDFKPLNVAWCSLASTELSGWMRYDGFYLSGHTTKVLPYVTSDIACWESCLQETSFLCLALAYATKGNRSCLLYDTKALFHYADWTSAAEMTYYEYCQNGNTKYKYKRYQLSLTVGVSYLVISIVLARYNRWGYWNSAHVYFFICFWLPSDGQNRAPFTRFRRTYSK